ICSQQTAWGANARGQGIARWAEPADQIGPSAMEVPTDMAAPAGAYLERRAQDLETMEQALSTGDFVAIQRLGHNMKGSGAGYGFPAISEIGKTLEDAAKSRCEADVRKAIGSLADYVEQ